MQLNQIHAVSINGYNFFINVCASKLSTSKKKGQKWCIESHIEQRMTHTCAYKAPPPPQKSANLLSCVVGYRFICVADVFSRCVCACVCVCVIYVEK